MMVTPQAAGYLYNLGTNMSNVAPATTTSHPFRTLP